MSIFQDVARVLLDGARVRWCHFTRLVRDGMPLWRWLAVAIAVFFLSYIVSAELADRVRLSGMLCQFIGLGTVVWGLNTSRKLFGKPSLLKSAIQWIARWRYIIKPPSPVNLTGHVQSGAAAGAGFAAVVGVPSVGSLEDRVAKLEEEVRNSISDTKADITNLTNQTETRFAIERSVRQTDIGDVNKRLEEAVIGGIHLELGGLAYLFGGIAFTSVPQETAWLLQKIGL